MHSTLYLVVCMCHFQEVIHIKVYILFIYTHIYIYIHIYIYEYVLKARKVARLIPFGVFLSVLSIRWIQRERRKD